jgi:DNA repair protein RadC
MEEIKESKIHAGHRERMRLKLITHGKTIFDTYELLEMLLYYTTPYKDTNPTAKQLLHRFGGLDGVLSASHAELTSVVGVGEKSAELIELVGRLGDIFGAEILPERRVDFSNYTSTGGYVCSCFEKYPESTCAVMLFDNGMNLIEARMLSDSSYGSAAFKPRFFIDLALSCGATVAITANRSQLLASYSTDAERMTTKMINNAFSSVGIYHMEHFAVSGKGFTSMLGRLPTLRSELPAVSAFLESREREACDI